MKRLALFAVVFAACVDSSDPRWQLDHDRIVAVRVSPPHLPAGATATVDALMAHKGAPTDVESPTIVTAAPHSLPSLAASVQADGSIVAPDEATLDAARAQLGVAAGDPVPFEIGVTFGDPSAPLVAIKSLTFGDSGDNPTLPPITVNGAAPVDGTPLTIPFDTDVPLTTSGVDAAWTVDWLTSCGTMHDDNEHVAFVHVQPSDPAEGQLAVVVRDVTGGVVWDVWSISSTAPPTK